MNQVSKVVSPNRQLLQNISLSFFPGAKIGVLGLNGAGKSTLLRIMAGVDREFSGEARPQAGIRVGYLPQEPELDPSRDVRGNVEDGVAHIKQLLTEFNAINDQFAEPMSDREMEELLARQGDLQTEIDAAGGWELDRHLEIAAEALRLPPLDAPVERLSGGEKRRVALCRLLLSNPGMLLLDEPTNHLDAESVAWLEQFLQSYAGTVVAVTHDRYFLDKVAGWILELDRGRGFPYQGNYSAWLEAKEKRLRSEERSEQARRRILKAELEWVRTQPQARRAKNKARLARFEELNSAEYQQRNATLELYIPPGPRLGDKVLEVEKVSKRFGDRQLMQNLSFTVSKGAIVGIIGGNGAGKSTLFRMICGSEPADSGNITLGETTVISYVDQSREGLDGNRNVWEEISDGQDLLQIGSYQFASRAYVGRFNFKGPDQQKFVKDLSGGERNRLQLAKTLIQGGNLLLLDEPTNDLDVETLQALEAAILAFPGSVLVISHDRWFLDRICTHTLAFEDDGITFFQGPYSEYEESRQAQAGDETAGTRRVRFK